MKHSTPVVRFHLLYAFTFSQRKKHKEQIIQLFAEENRPLVTLDYIFCSDEHLLKINQEYLHHDTLTDILTFDLSEKSSGIIGEIYISIDRIKENAILFHVPFSTELKRVLLHGALHLCGYTDKKTPDRRKMTAMENYYLKKSV